MSLFVEAFSWKAFCGTVEAPAFRQGSGTFRSREKKKGTG